METNQASVLNQKETVPARRLLRSVQLNSGKPLLCTQRILLYQLLSSILDYWSDARDGEGKHEGRRGATASIKKEKCVLDSGGQTCLQHAGSLFIVQIFMVLIWKEHPELVLY